MKLRTVAALFLALGCSSLAAGDSAPPSYQELPPGRYSVNVRGMLCTVCARAIAAEWSKIPEIEKATMNFEKEQGTVVVRLDSTMQVNALFRGLRRAERLAALGGKYELGAIKYIP